MHSRSITDMAASTVNTTPDGSGALGFPGEELQADIADLELLGESGEFEAALDQFVVVHDQGISRHRGSDSACESDCTVEFGAGLGAGGDLLGEFRQIPAARRAARWESAWGRFSSVGRCRWIPKDAGRQYD